MQPFLPSPLYAIIHGPLAVRFGNNLCTILKYVPNPFFQKVLDGMDEKAVLLIFNANFLRTGIIALVQFQFIAKKIMTFEGLFPSPLWEIFSRKLRWNCNHMIIKWTQVFSAKDDDGMSLARNIPFALNISVCLFLWGLVKFVRGLKFMHWKTKGIKHYNCPVTSLDTTYLILNTYKE